MDILIIGAGLSGATIAHQAAQAGLQVVLIEKRKHVGGNIYDYYYQQVLVHRYGPHIFHTDDEVVQKFMNQFWTLNNYQNRVHGYVQEKIIPIPFNFSGIDLFWPKKAKELKAKLTAKYGKDSRITISKLRETNDQDLKMIADFVYENIFANYTSKMWGIKASEIDPSVLARVPVVIGYGTRYFANKYEGLPEKGYTKAVEKMLDHPNIKIIMQQDACQLFSFKDNAILFQNKILKIPLVYTGPVDQLFNYEFGILNYRSLDIQFFHYQQEYRQNYPIINYPSHPTMTRTTEYKYLTGQRNRNTVISKEFPGTFTPKDSRFGEPYYPMASKIAKKQFAKYWQLAKKFPNLHLVGRLATYQYLDMDKAIKLALAKCKELW